MKAIVVGATGATGKDLVCQLLKDDFFDIVSIFVRRDPGLSHPKLRTHIVDFDAISEWAGLVQGDVLFSLLGTTVKQAGSQEQQWTVDYDYQLKIAEAAKANGVQTMELVSSIGADSQSRFFYTRMKGSLEAAIQALRFERLIILRPPSLVRRGSDRHRERIAVRMLKILNFVGLFKAYAPMKTQDVAKVMIRTTKAKGSKGTRIIEAEEMRIVAI